MKKMVFIFVSVLLIGACSQFDSNGDKQYRRSKNGARLVVPPPLTDSNVSHFYDLPPQNQDPSVNIAPPY